MADPLLIVGLIALGAALGALLTSIRYKATMSRTVREQVEKAQQELESSAKKGTAKDANEAA